ncbi:MAG: sodium/solute symporter [Phycisphaerae bacterium]|nr:sodium/solute symporter [Phycisphaerae bacterium]
MKNLKLLLILSLIMLTNAYAKVDLKWDGKTIPELPDKLGVAGPFVGVSNDALIVAGGANFPDGDTYDSKGDRKVYVDTGHVLEKTDNGYLWHNFKIDKPLAYGMSVSTEFGVICMGGCDSDKSYNNVFLLTWDNDKKTVTQTQISTLPSPCSFGAAALSGDYIYIAGGSPDGNIQNAMTNFWRAKLPIKDSIKGKKIKETTLNDIDNLKNLQWEKLPAWPGPSRVVNLLNAQHNGFTDCIYVMSGRHSDTGEIKEYEYLTDNYQFIINEFDPAKYDPAADTYDGKNREQYLAEFKFWNKKKDSPTCVMAGTSIAVGQSFIFVLSGADGSLLAKSSELKDNHPGFPKIAYTYHTITDNWIKVAGHSVFDGTDYQKHVSSPANPVTTTAVNWDGKIIIPTGEVRPKFRSPTIWSVELDKQPREFGILNFATIGVYLAAMVGVGFFFAKRNKNTDDFFRGGQRVPWVVAGLSIFATMLSSITFMAIPAKAFATNWAQFILNMTAVITAPLIVIFFLPFFRRLDAASAYQYLEKRFNVFVRLLASTLFILFQVGRMAVVLYLPAMALAAITPLDEFQCIALMGFLSVIYCTAGGLEAVVWTDAIQAVILLGGALVSFIIIICNVDGGFGGFIEVASAADKFHMLDMDFSKYSFTKAVFWVALVGGLGQSLTPYASDQAVVQRYMSVPSEKEAARAIWTNTVLVIPASLLFFAVGAALFVYYKTNPAEMIIDPQLQKNDSIFPAFIATKLPVGVAGLVVAAIFAAAQSTVSTSINSISTTLVTDFFQRFNVLKTEKGYLNLARFSTALFGIIGTILALTFASGDIKSLWDQFQGILGMFASPICGMFCLGMFTKRTNAFGAIAGVVCSMITLLLLKHYTGVHSLLHATISIIACVVSGYCFSLITPPPKKDLTGMTIFTQEKKINN